MNSVKKIGILVLLCLNIAKLQAQKPVIDSSIYGKWPQIGRAFISPDGKYVSYLIDNQPVGSQTLILCSINGKWNVTIPGANVSDAVFCEGVNKAVVKLSGDSLAVFSLEQSKIEYITHVNKFSLRTCGKEDWLAYSLSDESFVVQNLKTNASYKKSNVSDFDFDEKAKCIIYQTKVGKENLPWRLVCMSLSNGSSHTMWSGATNPNDLVFDHAGMQFAFVEGAASDQISPTVNIWRYKIGDAAASLLLNTKFNQLPKECSFVYGHLSFSKNGALLFFRMRPNQAITNPGNASVNIWNYNDKYLQSLQLNGNDNANHLDLFFTVNLNTSSVIQLNDISETVSFLPAQDNNDYVIVRKRCPAEDSYSMKKEDRPSLFLESLKDGSRTLIRKSMKVLDWRIYQPELSPNEKFALWFDGDSLNYYYYNVRTGKTENLSKSVPVALYDTAAVKIGRGSGSSFGTAGWLPNDQGLLIYDQYDIWKIDPTGSAPAINVTHSLGRQQNVALAIVNTSNNNIDDISSGWLRIGKGLVLEGFNTLNKQNGFWSLDEKLIGAPEKLIMEDRAYWIEGERTGRVGLKVLASTGIPIKARKAQVYLVKRMDASESPNLFVTTDFKSFRQLSHINPEKSYNWLTSELVTWKISKDQTAQGILYKPENFDPSRKYPIIFEYYEIFSDALNKFLPPDYSADRINIPTYVSNGYLVFEPDIYFAPQKPGESVVNALVSAARYLSQFSWVDSTKMGLQGHSFGGWETNFLVTHTHLFAAACEASGLSDVVSAYDELLYGSGQSNQAWFEKSGAGESFGAGVTPWTAGSIYIENSPVFFIDSITTPLLMMQTRKDSHVPFEQAIEMFMAMYRAGKKVWLLDYEKSDHTLSFGDEPVDYDIRMRQFFDYYLKGAPAPRWMIEGVPAKLKGIDKGYELEPGREP